MLSSAARSVRVLIDFLQGWNDESSELQETVLDCFLTFY